MSKTEKLKPATITSSDLQRKVGTVLKRVAVNKERLVVEREGYPIAAILPYAEFEQWERERARAEMLTFMDEQARLSKAAGLDTKSDEEAMADALKAVADVRREKRRKKR